MAVHIIDHDRFKNINDSVGHAVGDVMLQQAALRIRKLLGTRERLARLGADEFAVLQPIPAYARDAMGELGARIAAALLQPYFINDRSLQSGASIGYAVYPTDGQNAADLMRAAGVALHHAKLHARGQAVAFDLSMEVERKIRHDIEARLRQALANGEFELQFQPIFEAKSGVLRGFEALLRLNDAKGQSILARRVHSGRRGSRADR